MVSPDNAPPRRSLTEKIRLALIWTFHYWQEIFSLRFDKYMIIQVLPGVYGLALTAMALGLFYLSIEAMLQNLWRGLFYLFFAAPLTFLVMASILRALLEFYAVIFRMSEHLDELVGIRDTVDRLSDISDSVNEMSALTRRIPFWKAMTRSRRRHGQLTEPQRRRRASDHRDPAETTTGTPPAHPPREQTGEE